MATNSGPNRNSGMKDLPPELQNILADQDGNGTPDIADNPFKALGKLGDLMALSGKMNPMVQRYIQGKLSKMNVSAEVINQITGGALPGSPTGNEANTVNLISKARMESLSGAGGGMTASGATPPQVTTPLQAATPPRSTANMQAYLSANGVKTVQSNGGRNFLFIVGVLAVIGWLVWQNSGPEFRETVTTAVVRFFEE